MRKVKVDTEKHELSVPDDSMDTVMLLDKLSEKFDISKLRAYIAEKSKKESKDHIIKVEHEIKTKENVKNKNLYVNKNRKTKSDKTNTSERLNIINVINNNSDDKMNKSGDKNVHHKIEKVKGRQSTQRNTINNKQAQNNKYKRYISDSSNTSLYHSCADSDVDTIGHEQSKQVTGVRNKLPVSIPSGVVNQYSSCFCNESKRDSQSSASSMDNESVSSSYNQYTPSGNSARRYEIIRSNRQIKSRLQQICKQPISRKHNNHRKVGEGIAEYSRKREDSYYREPSSHKPTNHMLRGRLNIQTSPRRNDLIKRDNSQRRSTQQIRRQNDFKDHHNDYIYSKNNYIDHSKDRKYSHEYCIENKIASSSAGVADDQEQMWNCSIDSEPIGEFIRRYQRRFNIEPEQEEKRERISEREIITQNKRENVYDKPRSNGYAEEKYPVMEADCVSRTLRKVNRGYNSAEEELRVEMTRPKCPEIFQDDYERRILREQEHQLRKYKVDDDDIEVLTRINRLFMFVCL